MEHSTFAVADVYSTYDNVPSDNPNLVALDLMDARIGAQAIAKDHANKDVPVYGLVVTFNGGYQYEISDITHPESLHAAIGNVVNGRTFVEAYVFNFDTGEVDLI